MIIFGRMNAMIFSWMIDAFINTWIPSVFAGGCENFKTAGMIPAVIRCFCWCPWFWTRIVSASWVHRWLCLLFHDSTRQRFCWCWAWSLLPKVTRMMLLWRSTHGIINQTFIEINKTLILIFDDFLLDIYLLIKRWSKQNRMQPQLHLVCRHTTILKLLIPQ